MLAPNGHASSASWPDEREGGAGEQSGEDRAEGETIEEEGGGKRWSGESEVDEVDRGEEEEARRVDGIEGVEVCRFDAHTSDVESVAVNGARGDVFANALSTLEWSTVTRGFRFLSA